MRKLARIVLVAEVAVCFAPALALLLVGILLLPIWMLALVSDLAGAVEDSHVWATLRDIAMVLGGLAGCVAMCDVLAIILGNQKVVLIAKWRIFFVVTGILSLFPLSISAIFSHSPGWRIAMALPVFATLHILVLAREHLLEDVRSIARAHFPSRGREAPNNALQTDATTRHDSCWRKNRAEQPRR
jgi:hypothetical protein